MYKTYWKAKTIKLSWVGDFRNQQVSRIAYHSLFTKQNSSQQEKYAAKWAQQPDIGRVKTISPVIPIQKAIYRGHFTPFTTIPRCFKDPLCLLGWIPGSWPLPTIVWPMMFCCIFQTGSMFCQLGCVGIHVNRRLHAQWWHRCFATASEWNRWQRRCNRLSQLQGRIKFPPPTSITVEGVTHNLPVRTVGPPERHPTQEELEYLVGFFDGDGCVSMDSRTGSMRLKVSQSIGSAEVLFQYRKLLGGGISKESNGTGKQKATLQWQVSGWKMRHVAALLSQIPSMKHAQLIIAAGGNIAGPRRERIGEQLFHLKQEDHIAKMLKCTWAYFAGFFDAEGSVTVTPLSVGLRLEVAQLNPFVLERLLGFLHDSGLDRWWLRHGNCSQLVSTDVATSKQTLKHLLDHGLSLKKKQAQLALSLNAANHQQVREAVMSLNGWQNKYNRLDEEGLSRAKELQSLQIKSRQSTCLKEQELLQDTIQVLREEHVFQKLVSKCHLMRKDIRKMLSEGAFVSPPWLQSLFKFRSIMLQLCQSAPSGFVSIRCWLRIRFQTMKSGWSRSLFFYISRESGQMLHRGQFTRDSGRLEDCTTDYRSIKVLGYGISWKWTSATFTDSSEN